MKTKMGIAMAFVALAGLTGIPARAADGDKDETRRQARMERLDADKSGDVTFEEFAAAMKTRTDRFDANSDGRMTVEEIASEIEKRRAERRARRFVERFDTDGDQTVTLAEIENRQKKRFALLDRNDDGKVAMDELPGGRSKRDRR